MVSPSASVDRCCNYPANANHSYEVLRLEVSELTKAGPCSRSHRCHPSIFQEASRHTAPDHCDNVAERHLPEQSW